ncbi:hypothetical protein [Zoogloea sp.]|uniref:hypothetical protein n=1 Tax=Zoogloea sp. TaxID=49181 RepID=UPI00262A0E47|nr:hypothetical protein [Zoogloea sp.]
MGVRDLLAEHDDECFISLTDLLDVVAEAEGVPTKEVARAFSVCRLLHKVEIQLRKYDNNEISAGGLALAFHNLQEAILNTHINASADVLSEAREAEPGFLRQEVAVTLQECGIKVPPCLLKGRRTPLWKHVYAVREWVSLQAAASILTGKEPGAADSEDHQDFYHWREALQDAASSQLISVKDGRSALLNSTELSQADIRTWCDRNGFVWPIPMHAPISDASSATCISSPSTLEEVTRERDALRAELADVTKERDEAKAEEARRYDCYLTEWEGRKIVADERDKERARSAELAAEVTRLKAEVTRLQATPSPVTIDHSMIRGDTFKKLASAIEAFPNQYPDRAKNIKLDADLRPWLGCVFSCNEREKLVFSNIIVDHFTPEGWDIGS